MLHKKDATVANLHAELNYNPYYNMSNFSWFK